MRSCFMFMISGGFALKGNVYEYVTRPLNRITTYMRCNPSTMMNMEIRMRKIPFAKPDNVWIRV